LLNHVIRAALQVAEADSIVAVIGHQAEQVRASVTTPGIRFAEQSIQKGTGHAVLCASDQIRSKDGLLLILNGDGPLLRGKTLEALVESSVGNRGGGTLVTTKVDDPTGYGRIIRNENGRIEAIVEQKAATREQLRIHEINPGVYSFSNASFWRHIGELNADNAAKEYYLTDMVSILTRHGHAIAPLLVEDESELLGINTRVELSIADRILRARKTEQLMLAGVTIERPESVTIDSDVQIGIDTVIEANVQLRGKTRIGEGCRIGTGSVLQDCEVAAGAVVYPYVVAEGARVGEKAQVGPFARLRKDANICTEARVGNFVELKNTKFGRASKAQHLSYLGDAEIGENVNIGAGTITCNYDGHVKSRTEIGDRAFVGSNSTLVAPLEIGKDSYIGAGSVITKKVQQDSLAIGRAHQIDKEGWAKRRQEQKSNKQQG
jgi:bifunctional UDP-N-acetylglucosamine pyrophosphorylase/glucosamine-1-phosphate N-acetyltransferase